MGAIFSEISSPKIFAATVVAGLLACGYLVYSVKLSPPSQQPLVSAPPGVKGKRKKKQSVDNLNAPETSQPTAATGPTGVPGQFDAPSVMQAQAKWRNAL